MTKESNLSLVQLRPSCGGSTYEAGSSQKCLFDSNAFDISLTTSSRSERKKSLKCDCANRT